MKFVKHTIIWSLFITTCANAQLNTSDIKYRRSSLHTVMILDPKMAKADVITEAYKKAPIPEKFNDHTLSARSFDPDFYALSDEEKKAAGITKPSKAAAWAKTFASNSTGGLIDAKDTKDLPHRIDKFLTNEEIAKKIVAKWFNRSEKGTFDMKLISERGYYDASALDINKAKSSARGLAVLADAGEELIYNSFVIVSRFNYVSKQEIIDAANKTVNAVSSLLGAASGGAATQLASAGSNIKSDGYVVQSTTYLYKLVWNDSVQAVFYQDLWMDDSNYDPKRKAAFDSTKIFHLELIGDEKAWADVQSSVFYKDKSIDPIARATTKSVDAVIAKLQRKYEVFRTKTPLYSTDPTITAKIGLKEGLEKGDKYEVLEQTVDEQTGKTKYVKKGVIKVTEPIWDNRFTPEEMAADTSQVKIDRTTFKGGKDYYPGMLIRQKS